MILPQITCARIWTETPYGIDVKPFSQAQQQTAARIQQLMSGGAKERALADAETLARNAAETPDAHMLLAMCQTEVGDFKSAEQAFRTALDLAPDHPLILVNLATMYRKAGRPQPALRAYERATRRGGNMPGAWLGLSRSARECNELDRARSAIREHLRLQPKSPQGWHELGRVERAREDYESAADAFSKAARLAPDKGLHEYSRGLCERLKGLSDKALDCFERAAAKGYTHPDLENARIGALIDCGRSEEAVAAIQSLLERHPDFVPGYDTMADVYWEYGAVHGVDEDPSEVYRRAIDRQAGNHALRRSHAMFLLKARRYEQAAEVISALRREVDDPTLMTLQANALELAGHTDQSGRLYREVHGMLGDSRPDFLCAYTRHLLRAGQWREAEARALAATRIDPSDQEAWAYLGTAWRLLGDAREEWLFDYERTITFLEVPAPEGYENREEHLARLLEYLDTLHRANREPIQQSLRRGSQTAGRLFGRPARIIDDTQQALTATIEAWLGRLPSDSEHPFFQRNTGHIRYTGSWSVKLWKQGNHVNHIHPEGWISSAYYITLPPSVTREDAGDDDHAGCIHFGQPPDELDLDLAPRRLIRPKVGHLALFPSYMWHGTVPFDDDSPRMTIAFDMRARAKQ